MECWASGDSYWSIHLARCFFTVADMLRLDQLTAALACDPLWLMDACYAGTKPYVQAPRAAAQDGVDVRLLRPGSTDNPILSPLLRSGYQRRGEAGVPEFEWNGSRIHLKTAVADGFGAVMAVRYLRDLEHATETVLRGRNADPSQGRRRVGARGAAGAGSAACAAACAVRIGTEVSAALTDRRGCCLGRDPAGVARGVAPSRAKDIRRTSSNGAQAGTTAGREPGARERIHVSRPHDVRTTVTVQTCSSSGPCQWMGASVR